MTTLLTLPVDILEQIAILTSSPSLTDLLHLILTCRVVYQSLSVTANPHIYASISRRLFDTPFIRQGAPPDSSIAAEFVRRLRFTRRIRRGELTVHTLPVDLWTAYDFRRIAGDHDNPVPYTKVNTRSIHDRIGEEQMCTAKESRHE